VERDLSGSEDDFEEFELLIFEDFVLLTLIIRNGSSQLQIYLLYVYFLELAFNHVPVCACACACLCVCVCACLSVYACTHRAM
jgi:hypothetical protein